MGMLLRRRIQAIQEEKTESKHPEPLPQEKEDEAVVAIKYSREELSGMTVRQIREIAGQFGIAINKVIKEDVISEFLTQQG